MADLPDLTLPLPAPDLVARVNATEDRVAALEEDGGSGSLIIATGSTTIPAGSKDGELVGYRNSGGSTITVSGVTLAPGEWAVWGWFGGAWSLLNKAGSSGGIDETPPTAGTLAASALTDVSFTLTVTGASDDYALHATPYAFSTNGGTTWSAWQSSAVYPVTGRTPETTYQCRHKVRDSAGNETTGTTINVTTEALPPPTLPITDAFTEPDGTGVNGRAVGGFVWSSDITANNTFVGGGAYEATIQGGRATNGAGTTTVGAMMDVGVGTVRVSAKLTSPTGSGGGLKIGFGKVIAGTTALDGVYLYYNRGQGVRVYAGDGDGSAPELLTTYTGAGTGAQTDLPCSIAWDGTTITATVDGATILTVPYALTGGTKVGFQATASPGFAWDDFTVEDVSP